MLLVIDIGNSNIVINYYENKMWQESFRLSTHTTGNQLEEWQTILPALNQLPITGAILSSVVPQLTQQFANFIQENLQIQPLIVQKSLYDQLPITINNKEEIGTDLVANALAGFSLNKGTCIVIDFGTALTFTTVAADGKILGVAIAPGLKIALHSLFQNAAQLPEVPLEVPTSALGNDTFHALQAGVLLGYTGLINGLVQRIDNELDTHCFVVATGGLSFLLKDELPRVDLLAPHLTLDGLRLIYELVD